MGHLGKDPVVRRTQNDTAVCNLDVASTYRNGEDEHTEWHRIVVWGKSAENCGKYLNKGRGVLVEGRLQTSTYEKDGETRYKTEIVAQNVQFLGDGKGGGGKEKGGPQPNANPQHSDASLDDIPF
jgi:single-strand DNA-binding protein